MANKADLPEGRANLPRLREAANGLKVVGASAKLGDNLSQVVKEMLRIREEYRQQAHELSLQQQQLQGGADG